MRRKATFSVMALVLLMLWVGRIYAVNASADTIPQEFYEMGEWVPVEDGYIIDEYIERNEGYSFRVNSAEIMSPAEFAARYARDGVDLGGTELAKGERSVLAMSITMRNEGNVGGGIMSYMWRAVSASNDWECKVDDELFSLVEDTGQEFRIGTDKSYTTVFPFTCYVDGPLLSPTSLEVRDEIRGREFTMNFTTRPVMKTTYISVS